MKKWLIRSVLALVLLVVIAVLIYTFTIDSIIRSQVESNAKAALGQDTTLQAANLKTLAGTLTLDSYATKNPTGFSGDHFLAFGSCKIAVQPRSLLSDTVRIDEISLDGLSLNIEQAQFKNNLADILSFVLKQQQSAAKADAAPAASSSAGKQLDIGKITLKNVKLAFNLSALPGMKAQGQTFTLDNVVIERPLDPNGRPARLVDVLAKVLLQITVQAANDPKIPAEARTALKAATDLVNKDFPSALNDLANLKGVDLKGVDLKNPGKAIEDIFKKK